MYLKCSEGPRVIFLDDGSILSQADLPKPDMRWSARRKAVVVAAVKGGLVSKADAMARYDMSEEEFNAWEEAFARNGTNALKVKNGPR